MKVRFGLILGTALAIVAGACATAGGAGGGGGVQPSNNQYTTSATLYLQQARAAQTDSIAHQKYVQALDAAKQGIKSDSTNPQSYYQAGFALVMMDSAYDEADTLLSKATTLYPDYKPQVDQIREQAWINLYNSAIQPLNNGNTQEAIRLFQKANDMYQGRPEAYLNLGAAYSQIGETERAADAFRQALQVSKKQEDQLAQADSVDPKQRDAIERDASVAAQNLGQMLMQLNWPEDAVQVYSDFASSHPQDIQALTDLATALSKANMADSAQAIYQGLLNKQGLDAQQYITIGVGLYQADQYKMAAQAFQNAKQMEPKSRDAAYNLAEAYYAGQMWDQAVQAARDVLQLDPRNGNVYKLLARSLAQSGDQQAGGDALDKYQALSFEVQGLQLQPSSQGGATVSGVLTNHKVQQGNPIVLRFHFLDSDGNEIGTKDQTIPAPAQGADQQFQALFSSDKTPTAYWYEVEQG